MRHSSCWWRHRKQPRVRRRSFHASGGNRLKDAPCMLLGHWTSTMPPLLLRSAEERGACLHAPSMPFGELAPRKTPTTSHSPVRIRPGPQHAASSMHSRCSQAPAHSANPADARSIPRRSSDVNCVIIPRLDASDAKGPSVRGALRTLLGIPYVQGGVVLKVQTRPDSTSLPRSATGPLGPPSWGVPGVCTGQYSAKFKTPGLPTPRCDGCYQTRRCASCHD